MAFRLDRRRFGNVSGSIVVHFHNGTAVVPGYILHQQWDHSFWVSDGNVTKLCSLAQNLTDATTLHDSLCTFRITTPLGVQHVRKLQFAVALTVEGGRWSWRSNTVDASHGCLELIS